MLDSGIVNGVENAAVGEALQDAVTRLSKHLNGDRSTFTQVFGNSDALESVLDRWSEAGVPTDNIHIVSATLLPGADASYRADTDTISISDSVAENASHERLVDILVEELGHRLDAQLGGDTQGDEGRSLAIAIRGEPDVVSEEDNTVLDDGSAEPAAIENATSVSDSGGYEGSSQTLTLEVLTGSTLTYSYQHYSIPDQFIIRYEGVNIVDTGFTGGSVNGLTVEIPEGTSDQVQVIVATDDQGTAWNYSVTAEPLDCDIEDPWTISTSGDPFEMNEDTGFCEGSGDIVLGRSDGSGPLLRINGTSKTSFNENVLQVRGGSVYSAIGGINERLFSADFDLNLNTGIASLSGISQGDFQLAGVDVEFKSMSVLRDRLAFDVRFQMPDAASGLIIETTDFFDDALQITNNGASPILGFSINPPGDVEFKFADIIKVSASDIEISYRGQEDALRFQSKIKIEGAVAKTEGVFDALEADLSGDNYLQVNSDGEVELVGSLTVEGDLPLVGGWSIQELSLNVDTTSKEIGGSAILGTPFGVRFGDDSAVTVRPEVEFTYDPFELDKVGLTLDNLNKPIPAYPVFFFQRIGGSVDNFAPSNNKSIEGTATIGASIGPKIAGTSLALATLDATLTSDSISGKMTSDILTANFTLDFGIFDIDAGQFTLIKDTSEISLDWSKGEIAYTGTSNVFDGFFVSTGSFKANSNFDFSMSRTGQLAIPDFVPTFGGTQIAGANLAVNFTNDENYSNDYAAGWGTYTVNTLFKSFDVTLGLRVNFDGSIERIGAANIPTTSSWFIEGGQDYAMLTANWENDNADVKVVVIKPDGTVIEEADFLDHRIEVVSDFSDGNSRTVIIDTPTEGTWDLEIVDTTGLGDIYYEATGAVELPELEFTDAPMVNADGSVTYTIEASTTTPVTRVSYFYDDDLTELDGLAAGEAVLNDGIGTFTWDAAQVVPGTYYLYAMVDDGSGPIVYAQTDTAVTVGSEADLGIKIEGDVEEAQAGDTIRYSITVQNNSGTTAAVGTTVLLTLPTGVTLDESSVAAASTDLADLAFDLGDMAADETRSFTVDVVVDSNIANGSQLGASAYVLADTYDSETANDTATTQQSVPHAARISTAVDISVDSKIDEVSDIVLNDRFTYTVSVTNSGTQAATNVVLTEIAPNLSNIVANVGQLSTSGNETILSLGTIDAGETVDVEFTATAGTAGQVNTTSSVIADGFDTAIKDNEELNVQVVTGASPDGVDLSLGMTADLSTVDDSVTVTMTLNNAGPGIASDVEVQLNLPAGATVESYSAIQGSFDSATGIWNLGNMRDNLTRTITVVLLGVLGTELTAEVIEVSETDTDSTPNDQMGDDFASVIVGNLSQDIDGTDGDDILTTAGGDDTIDGMAGDDVITPGLGVDLITTGEGNDRIVGTLAELNGDTISDLSTSDMISIVGTSFVNDGTVMLSSDGDALEFDVDGDDVIDGSISVSGLPSDGNPAFWSFDGETRVAFVNMLTDLAEGAAVEDDDVNGIANQFILTGDGIRSFSLGIEAKQGAAYDNALGVYEISETGEITDIRILASNVKDVTEAITIDGVEAGNTLGFFTVADGADEIAVLTDTDTFSFVAMDGSTANADAGDEIFLAVNGVIIEGDTFHSYNASLNGGVQHAVSGLSDTGDAFIIGFEDQAGGGDRDYQDVLFSIDLL